MQKELRAGSITKSPASCAAALVSARRGPPVRASEAASEAAPSRLTAPRYAGTGREPQQNTDALGKEKTGAGTPQATPPPSALLPGERAGWIYRFVLVPPRPPLVLPPFLLNPLPEPVNGPADSGASTGALLHQISGPRAPCRGDPARPCGGQSGPGRAASSPGRSAAGRGESWTPRPPCSPCPPCRNSAWPATRRCRPTMATALSLAETTLPPSFFTSGLPILNL